MGEFKASILRLGLKQELSASSSSKKEIRAWKGCKTLFLLLLLLLFLFLLQFLKFFLVRVRRKREGFGETWTIDTRTETGN